MIRFLTTRLVAVAWLGVWAGPLACGADDEALVTFDQVRPVLRKHCGACHNPARPRGEFDVSTVASIKVGSTSGPTAIPGKPDESTLYLLPAHLEEPKMPPNRPRIPARELELIRRWIEGGLKEKTGTVVRAPAPAAKPSPVAARADANRPQSEIVGSGAVPRPAEGVRVEPWPRRSAITALAFSPVSPWWAIAGKRQVLIYRWPDRKPLTALAFPEGDIFSLRFSRDGRWLLAGGGVGATSGTVVGFEVASGRRAFAVGDASDAVLACDISPDGKLVALGGPDRTIAVHRVSDGQLVATLRKHTDWILGLAFSPDGLLLASGDRFGGLQVWDTLSWNEFHSLRGHTGAVHGVAWSDTSDRMYSAGQDGTLRAWDMHDGREAAQFDAGVGGVVTLDVHATGRIVCGGRAGKVAIWDRLDATPRHVSLGDEVTRAAISWGGMEMLVADVSGNLAAFDLAAGNRLDDPELPVTSVSPAALARQASVSAPRTMTSARNSVAREELSRAERQSDAARGELTAAREALEAAQSALKSAEAAAERLRRIVASREAAAREAAQRVAELRSRGE